MSFKIATPLRRTSVNRGTDRPNAVELSGSAFRFGYGKTTRAT